MKRIRGVGVGVVLAAVFAAAWAVGCSGGGKARPHPLPTEPCTGTPWPDQVCIAGGYFLMGHDPLPQTEGFGYPYAYYAPKHWVKLSPFFMDVYPITNAEYKKCFDDGACPDECQGTGACIGGRTDSYHMADPTLADYPMATATPAGAAAYCAWMGKRLPTEAEWERAARGPKDYDYPWGNNRPDCSTLHCGGLAQPNKPAPYYFYYPVREGGADVSPEGVRDMVTNVDELVHDWFGTTYYQVSPLDNPQGPPRDNRNRAGRGKYFWVEKREFGVDAPYPAWSREGYTTGGFRCARDGASRVTQSFIALRRRILTGRPTAARGDVGECATPRIWLAPASER